MVGWDGKVATTFASNLEDSHTVRFNRCPLYTQQGSSWWFWLQLWHGSGAWRWCGVGRVGKGVFPLPKGVRKRLTEGSAFKRSSSLERKQEPGHLGGSPGRVCSIYSGDLGLSPTWVICSMFSPSLSSCFLSVLSNKGENQKKNKENEKWKEKHQTEWIRLLVVNSHVPTENMLNALLSKDKAKVYEQQLCPVLYGSRFMN